MKITNLLSNLILEQSRYQILYDKMVKPEKGKKGLVDFNVFKEIIFADPTTIIPQGFDKETATEKDMENVKVGKYTQWIFKNYLAPKQSELSNVGITPDMNTNTKEYQKLFAEFKRRFVEDLLGITTMLQRFDRFNKHIPLDKRDINKLSPTTLQQVLDEIPEDIIAKKFKKEEKTTDARYDHPGGQKVFDGANWIVIKLDKSNPLAVKAAEYYGGEYKYQAPYYESKWCTSPVNGVHVKGYLEKDPLFVIFPKDSKGKVGGITGLPQERYQFHFQSNQFMDRLDHQIPLVEKLNGEMSELKEFFKPYFMKDLKIYNSSRVAIDYPNDKFGKYVVLYGLDDLIVQLPETLTFLMVDNKSSEKVSLVVPETISRFKNLETLSFINIIKSLPETIGELKNLSFISFENNKELKSLPKSIVELNEIQFLNINGSNVKLSEEQKQVFEKVPGGFYIMVKDNN